MNAPSPSESEGTGAVKGRKERNAVKGIREEAEILICVRGLPGGEMLGATQHLPQARIK